MQYVTTSNALLKHFGLASTSPLFPDIFLLHIYLALGACQMSMTLTSLMVVCRG